jgi:ABC-type uncharacterized transport system permease subunit
MSPNATLYAALVLYSIGTLLALGTLFAHDRRTQLAALGIMIGGFVCHTIWIGGICVRTGHPPLTNLPEASAFTAWTVFAVELALFVRYRVHAASFFVYPLVLMLSTVAAVVHEPFVRMDPALRSGLFTTHVFLSTVGVAALFIGLAFTMLAFVQDRALKSKRRGALWDWIPSLEICAKLSYRATAVGFSIYTLGLLAGILWNYRINAGLMDMRVKQVGAVVAWLLFAVLLQSFLRGAFRARRTLVISIGAFVATLVAILGINHV